MQPGPIATIFAAFLRLGLTSFGGPVAHIGYFRTEFVARRRWLSDDRFAALLALCQALPGPASSQLGVAIGWQRAGWWGALAAFVGFTLPSALVMIGFALLWRHAPDSAAMSGVLAGLKIVAVAVVAEALRGMATTLTPDRPRIALALMALAGVSLWPGSALAQVGVIAVGMVLGAALRLGPGPSAAMPVASVAGPTRRLALAALIAVAAGMVLLPLLAQTGGYGRLIDIFWRGGALVFGGGHVVLPMLEAGTVAEGLVSPGAFLAGYGMAQALPGPLFTFAAFLGHEMAGLTGAVLALLAVFAPGFLLLMGVLPFWSSLAARPAARHALAGANAAVVGVLAAALYHPVMTGGLHRPADAALAAALWAGLAIWRLPPWVIVIAGAAGGLALSAL